jgi:Cu-Zn family superoxide dismutase
MLRSTLLVFFVFAAAIQAHAVAPGAKAELRDASGKVVGAARLREVATGVEVIVEVMGLKPGKHGLHIHSVGKCEGPDFKSAGAHFNPHGKQHGLDNPLGAHGGDMPNLEVGGDGKGQATLVARGVTLGEGPASLFGKDGTALVVHADLDDGKTDPAGNAGARIACGVLTRA